jgi:hypothetical protein
MADVIGRRGASASSTVVSDGGTDHVVRELARLFRSLGMVVGEAAEVWPRRTANSWNFSDGESAELAEILEEAAQAGQDYHWLHRTRDDVTRAYATDRRADALRRLGWNADAEYLLRPFAEDGDMNSMLELAELAEEAGRLTEARHWLHRAAEESFESRLSEPEEFLRRGGFEHEADRVMTFGLDERLRRAAVAA